MELYNQQAEVHSLAGMLKHPDAYWTINDCGLTHEDFLSQEGRRVMRAVQSVVGDRKQPDLPLVVEELRNSDDTTLDYLNALMGLSCSTPQAHEYVRTVKGLSTSRQLTSAGARIIEIAREARSDAEGALSEAESELRRVRQAMPMPDRSPDPADILRRVRARGPEAIPIRFSPRLNDLTGGYMRGHLWVVGGFSSTGKSAVACNIILDGLSRSDIWVGAISTEMTQEQYLLRLLSLESGIPQLSLRDHLPATFEQAQALKIAESRIARANVRIYDNVYRISDVRSTAVRMKETVGLDLFVVDFLQNVRGSAGDFAFKDMTEIILDLQQLAKDLRCTVIAFSQLSDAQAKYEGDDSFYAFKGSGAIKDAADMAIMLKRDRVRKSPILDFHVLKNRHGVANVVIPTHMDLPTGKITEMDGDDDDD